MGLSNVALATLAIPQSTTAMLTGISGAATTYTATVFSFAINGKSYIKATASGAATPTTDSAGARLADQSLAGLVLATGFGTVVVWTVNSSGTVALYRGETTAVDAAGNFIIAPEFPLLPDSVCPFAYTIHKNISGSNFTIGSTNWSTASTTHLTQNVTFLPDRPQVS